jgi:hypothetical protein
MQVANFEQAAVALIADTRRTSAYQVLRELRPCHPTSGELVMLINVLADRVARSQNGMSEAARCEMLGYLDAAADVAMAADDAEQVSA